MNKAIKLLKEFGIAILVEVILTTGAYFTGKLTFEMIIVIIILTIVFGGLLFWFRWDYENERDRVRKVIDKDYKSSIPVTEYDENLEYRFEQFTQKVEAEMQSLKNLINESLSTEVNYASPDSNPHARILRLYHEIEYNLTALKKELTNNDNAYVRLRRYNDYKNE